MEQEKKIKASDLMQGDWVCFGKSFPMQVVGTFKDVAYLDFEGNESDMWEVKEEELVPIPITQEILEKIGFKKEIYDNWLGAEVFESENKQIQIMNLSHSIGKDWHIHIDNEDMETIRCADIQYVHELQHELKGAGIKKEIEL